MEKLVYVFLADGFEEVEGLTAVDLLRRAGAEVKTVSVTGKKQIMGAHEIRVESDLFIEELDAEKEKMADMLVLPGGMPGTTHLKEHQGLAALLKKQHDRGGFLAAICAAPSVFAGLGFLEGKRATSYPDCVDPKCCGSYVEEAVVRDGHVITSRGVGTAIPFALTLIEVLMGKDRAEEVAASILYR